MLYEVTVPPRGGQLAHPSTGYGFSSELKRTVSQWVTVIHLIWAIGYPKPTQQRDLQCTFETVASLKCWEMGLVTKSSWPWWSHHNRLDIHT